MLKTLTLTDMAETCRENAFIKIYIFYEKLLLVCGSLKSPKKWRFVFQECVLALSQILYSPK